MSEKNNKIKIGELLKTAKVTNLKKYLNKTNDEVLSAVLFKELCDKIRVGKTLLNVASDVFILVVIFGRIIKTRKVLYS